MSFQKAPYSHNTKARMVLDCLYFNYLKDGKRVPVKVTDKNQMYSDLFDQLMPSFLHFNDRDKKGKYFEVR